MKFQLRSLLAAVALLIATCPFAVAVDLLYVSLGDDTIVPYDTTGNDGTAIAATKATFANTNLNIPLRPGI